MSEPTVHFSSPVIGVARVACYAVLTLLLLPPQLLANLLRLPLAQRLPMFYHRMCCRILGVRLEVFGRRSRARPTLFVGNHASYLDIIVYGALIPGSFVAKAEIAKWPFFSWLAKAQRSVFVDRRMRTANLQASELQGRLDAGDDMILFPEGTSDDGNRVLDFKSALFSVAEFKAHGEPVTVQPVSVTYSRLDGMPIGRHLRPYFAWYGDMDLLPHARELVSLGRLTVTVTFHEPVTIAQFASRKDLAQYCQEVVMRGHVDALAGRIQPQVGAVGRSRWIRWRTRPRLRDMKGLRRAPGLPLVRAVVRRRKDRDVTVPEPGTQPPAAAS
ncbi:MAG: lysophospholipid acyltransferase family protein [Alphaproteobacteria bacterium]|jgi:1-acyl-sn-glycerol-3-phosphate acyltransferase